MMLLDHIHSVNLELVPVPQSKMLSHLCPLSSAAAPSCFRAAGHEGSTGGKGTAWPWCDVLPQHIPGVCEQPGEALASCVTCVVTSMSLDSLGVTPGVSLVFGSRDGPAAAPGLIPKVSPVHAPPAPRFGASPNSSPQVFLSALTLPRGKGREGAACSQQSPWPSPAALTTTKHRSRILHLCFFFPLSTPFLL